MSDITSRPGDLHRWDVTPSEARAIQRELAARVIRTDPLDFFPQFVAGIDIGFEQNGEITRAAVVVLDYNTLQPLECVIARRATHFPYVPGLLSFRECPTALDALAQLQIKPDVLLCDGMGIAHPRRLGIASHLGLLTDTPSLGVGKSLLTGWHEEVPAKSGAWTPLFGKREPDRSEIIGAMLRTRANCKPLIISLGHRLTLETSIALVLHCTTRYRIPETTRWADGIASRKAAFLRTLPVPLREAVQGVPQGEIPGPV
ncbi:MAG TPA: deoxyribonuclease V [Spongiibacteraceae bacterium]